MEQEIIRLLDADLECTSCRWKKDRVVMEVRSITNQIRCPYCGSPSTKVHSAYQREIQDIALLLHSSTSTILNYLAIPKDQIPESRENARERQYIQSRKNKQDKMEKVRTLYAQGHAIDEITRLTGHTSLTVKNYLKEDYPMANGHYDQRRPEKLAPYEKTIIQILSQGITYREIHECICRQGYTGTIASLRVFMQKERIHQKRISESGTTAVAYIPRKCRCQLLYHKLEDVKSLTQEQYEEALKKYPILGQIYSLQKEFHRIVFSKHDKELDTWIDSAFKLQIEERKPYIHGLKNDILAVKNGIILPSQETFVYSNSTAPCARSFRTTLTRTVPLHHFR